METLKKEINQCENWSERAINQIKHFLNKDDVLRVLFDIKNNRKNYYFGDVSIEALPKQRQSVVSTDFGNALIAIDEAVHVDFRKGLNIYLSHIFMIRSIFIIQNNLFQPNLSKIDQHNVQSTKKCIKNYSKKKNE